MGGTGFTRHGVPPGPFKPRELTFDLMLCFCSLILHHFVFELVFCKSGSMGQGSTYMSGGGAQYVYACHDSWLPFVYSVCDTPGAQNADGPTVQRVLHVPYSLVGGLCI